MSSTAYNFSRYRGRDYLIAGLLFLFILALSLGTLSRGVPDWGDDFAAYLAEGIAISEGTLEEQVKKNFLMPPTLIPRDSGTDELVYVWGYPLLLSAVHRLVGFDQAGFTSIIYYKIPSACCFALLAGILYLFYKRRFPTALSIFISILFCTVSCFFSTTDMLCGDVVYLFAAMLTTLLYECFAQQVFRPASASAWILGLILGVSMWFTYEVRLNGKAVIVVCMLSHGLYIAKNRSAFSIKRLPVHILPYMLFLALKLISESILLPATSNLSDIGSTNLQNILLNIRRCYVQTTEFLNDFAGFNGGIVLLLICAIGFFTGGFRLQNLYLTLLFAGTYAVVISLPYSQGIRYLYNILPVVAMYLVYGCISICSFVYRKLRPGLRKAARYGLIAAMILICVNSGADIVADACANVKNDFPRITNDVFAPDAIEMYNYIRNNTDEDSEIAFLKPRLLYLATNRVGIQYLFNISGRTLMDADYYLHCTYLTDYNKTNIPEKYPEHLSPVHTCGRFTLYEII